MFIKINFGRQVEKSSNGAAGTVESTCKVFIIDFENIGTNFWLSCTSRGSTFAYELMKTYQYITRKCALLDITSINCQVSKLQKVGSTLDHCFASSSSIFQLVSRLSSLSDLQWYHIHLEKPLWWGRWLNNLELRRLRHHPNGWVLSRPRCWQLNG